VEETVARQALVAAGARLRSAGLIAGTEGNLSLRLDGGSLLITPSGRRKDELGPGDLVVVGLENQAAGGSEGNPSSDVAIHRRIYSARDDVSAIAHAHPPASLAMTLAGERPDPAVLPETAMLLPRLPFVALATPGSAELAQAVATSLAAGASGEELPVAVLLERHGAIAVGSSIDEAVDRLELVEVLCRAWWDARMLGWAPTPAPSKAGPQY
jgi:L-fuculose-phosphate aldolase